MPAVRQKLHLSSCADFRTGSLCTRNWPISTWRTVVALARNHIIMSCGSPSLYSTYQLPSAAALLPNVRLLVERISALLFCVTLAFQVSAPATFDVTTLGMAFFYNRHIMSASAVLFLQTFGSRSISSIRENAIEVALAACLLNIMFLTKISGFLFGPTNSACGLPATGAYRPSTSKPMRDGACVRCDHRNRVQGGWA